MLRALLALVFAFAFVAPQAVAQPAPPPGPQADWYYISGNQVQGPYTLPEMEEMTTRGVIRPSTQVYDPASGWAFAKDTPALQPFLTSVAPPPPGAPPPPPAPPAAGSQAALDAEAQAFLAGGWEGVTSETIAGRVFETTMRYEFRSDGSYVGSMSTRMPETPDLQPLIDPFRGHWSVSALQPDEFVITLNAGNGMPPDQLGLRVLDNTTMTSMDGKIRYRRVP